MTRNFKLPDSSGFIGFTLTSIAVGIKYLPATDLNPGFRQSLAVPTIIIGVLFLVIKLGYKFHEFIQKIVSDRIANVTLRLKNLKLENEINHDKEQKAFALKKQIDQWMEDKPDS